MILVIVLAVIFIAFIITEKVYYQKHWDDGLSLDLSFDKRNIFRGEKSYLLETITNTGKLPLPMVRIKFQADRSLKFTDIEANASVTDKYYRNDVFSINGQQRITRSIPFEGSHRGCFIMDSVDAVSSDLFLSSHFVTRFDAKTMIYVFPKPFESEQFSRYMAQISGNVSAKRSLLTDPFEMAGIRPYVDGDDVRIINPKASARGQGLMVNTYGYTNEIRARIYINCEDDGIFKRRQAVEKSFDIAVSLVKHLLSLGVAVEVNSNGKEIKRVAASNGTKQFEEVCRSLSLVDAEGEVESFSAAFKDELMASDGTVLNYIISPNSYTDFTDVLKDMMKERKDFKWFYPYEGESIPEVEESLKDRTMLLRADI